MYAECDRDKVKEIQSKSGDRESQRDFKRDTPTIATSFKAGKGQQLGVGCEF